MTIKLIQTILITLIATLTLNAEVAVNEYTLSNNGGDGVAISSEWAFIGDKDACLVRVYKLDYTTMLWGDGITANVPFQTLGTNCNANGFRSFGTAVSYSDGWVAIGAPGAKGMGVIHLYEYAAPNPNKPNELEWVKRTGNQGLDGPGQDGGEFGASISARHASDTTISIVVGAPKDGDSAVITENPGKAYIYTYDTVGETLSIPTSYNGNQAGELFGFSVTSDGTRFLIGAPSYDGINGNTDDNYGRAVYFGAGTFDEYVGTTLNAERGKEVSLSADYYMLLSGNVSTAFDGTEDPPSTIIKEVIGTNGGDVSQSNGVVAFAFKDSAVKVYPNIEIGGVLDPAPHITISKSLTNFGEDINLYKDQLIVNGSTNNAAYVYDFPCGIKPGELKAFEWAIVSVPCGDGTAVIGDIFTDDLGVYGDNDNWVMYEQNGTDYNGTFATMRQMLVTDAMELGKGYWIITDTDSTWKVDDTVVAVRTSGDIVNDGVVIPNETIKKYFIYELPDSNTTVEQKVMVGNPYPRTFQWENVYFLNVTTGRVGQINDAIYATPYIRPNAYVYDTTQQEVTGQPYRSITVNTPGTSGEIAPNQGFWIMLEKNRTGSNDLRIPFEK